MLHYPQYATIEVIFHQLLPYQPPVEADDDNRKAAQRCMCAQAHSIAIDVANSVPSPTRYCIRSCCRTAAKMAQELPNQPTVMDWNVAFATFQHHRHAILMDAYQTDEVSHLEGPHDKIVLVLLSHLSIGAYRQHGLNWGGDPHDILECYGGSLV